MALVVFLICSGGVQRAWAMTMVVRDKDA